MPPENETPWQRLGRMLAERREEVGARYRNKLLFATERRLNRRMLWSIEKGARDTYTPETLRDIEDAYMLVRGSVQRVLAGGDLEPAEVDRLAARPGDGDFSDDQDQSAILAGVRSLYPGDRVAEAIMAQWHKPLATRQRELHQWREIDMGKHA